MVSQNIKFIAALATMYLGFIVHFYFDEKLLDKSNQPQPYPYRSTLPFYNSLFNVICAICVLTIRRTKNIPKNPLPYFWVSFFMFLSTTFTTAAKGKMDFASLNVFKSAKPIAVLILAIVVYKRKIPMRKVIVVIVLCIGLILFGFKKSKASSDSFSPVGYAYIIAALFSEGIYSPLIDTMNQKTGNSYITMLFTHSWLSLIAFLLNFPDIIASMKFIAENPIFIYQILRVLVFGGIAQMALYTVVALSNCLVLSIATTSRKFVTILLSSILFHHNFTPIQWVGIVIVFAALGYDILGKKPQKKEKVEPEQKQE